MCSRNEVRASFGKCSLCRSKEPRLCRGPGYADVGAEVILVPTAIDHGGSYVPEVLVRARAAENGITIAYANHAGSEGRILGKAGRRLELMIADVPETIPDPDSADYYLGDRRPDVYLNWRGQQ